MATVVVRRGGRLSQGVARWSRRVTGHRPGWLELPGPRAQATAVDTGSKFRPITVVESNPMVQVKGKCALGPFLYFLVIKCTTYFV
jgi:hypothetical protein